MKPWVVGVYGQSSLHRLEHQQVFFWEDKTNRSKGWKEAADRLSTWLNLVETVKNRLKHLSWSRSQRPAGVCLFCLWPDVWEASKTWWLLPVGFLPINRKENTQHIFFKNSNTCPIFVPPTLTSLSGMSSSLGPPISSSSSSFFFFWFLSCFSFSAFFFSSSSWAFFWARRCLFRSFFSSLSERLAGGVTRTE